MNNPSHLKTEKPVQTNGSTANLAPPGHYLLFVLNKEGVPSIGHIARLSPGTVAPVVHNAAAFPLLKADAQPQSVDLVALDKRMMTQAGKPPVVVGVTPSCPYGIGACWGGAYDALQQLSGIKSVRPLPDSANSTAFLYLKEDGLPDIDAWREEFAEVANGSYVMRGIEMTLKSTISEAMGLLTLVGQGPRPDVVLAPLQAPDKIQWDIASRASRPMTTSEETAYARLSAALERKPPGTLVEVTGPVKKNGGDFFLEVRDFRLGNQ